MPHICSRCGKEYPDASEEVLKGCVCGSTTFIYQKKRSQKNDSPIASQKKGPDETKNVKESNTDTKTHIPSGDSPESITIVRPGEYDINLVQMAQSPDRVVKIGSDGEYRLNLHSMMRKKKQ
ncbi:MAG: hypothetical protein JXA44_05895 [Methanospirillaceae archaeon]|nr:hypothetical protein [Methanospirillaceae archaeon]